MTTYPTDLTPALKDALSLMLWHCGGLATARRALGHEIPHKAEEEQAAILHWVIPLAIEHGDGWRKIVGDELQHAADAQKAKEVA